MQRKWIGVLWIVCALAACRDDRIEAPYYDGGWGADGTGNCQGGSQGPAFDLPEGPYTGTISANDATKCGLNTTGGGGDQVLEVAVTEHSITVDPGKPAQVSITRAGNKLCGTSQREFRLTQNSNLCILDETDRINGEVTADGTFWVDLDFAWKRKGGVCNGLTLPCTGRTTWSFVVR